MSSADKIRERIVRLDYLSADPHVFGQAQEMVGWHDLTPEQLDHYRRLRRMTLAAEAAEHDYLNSLLPEPLDPAVREARTMAVLPEWTQNISGDGQEEDYAMNELESMSDWEFVHLVGLTSDDDEEDS